MAKSMIRMQRRYWDGLSDEYQGFTRIALDDFHYGPQIPGERELKLLPKLKRGMTSLELGCGGAQNSIWLARKKGMRCTAVDISSGQLRHAMVLAKENGVQLKLVKSPLERYRGKVRGRFDLVHSSHAMEFVDNPAAVIKDMAKSLKPGGVLMISTVHPLYNGEWIEGEYEETNDYAGDGLFLTSYFVPPDDVRCDTQGNVAVISRAYPASAWFKWLRAAKLDVVAFEEPPAVPQGVTPPYTSDAWSEADSELDAIPGTIIFLAKKPLPRKG